jgi:outer membrane immunogenic protein
MKKFLLALTALAAFTGSAPAADLPAATYTKAPPPVVAPNWTGFYLFGGGGYGLWEADTTTVDPVSGACLLCFVQKQGGTGYYGTVGGGYDWQFNGAWVAGIFGDGQFGSINGTIQDQTAFFAGDEKLRTSYAAGVRVGYLVAPNVLSYVNGGYSGSQWSGTNMMQTFPPPTTSYGTPSFTRNGWFIGGGVENSFDFFGISAPGWFMKTEYRVADYNTVTLPDTSPVFPLAPVSSITFKPIVQTISTSLVYRFNWGGPVVAKY